MWATTDDRNFPSTRGFSTPPPRLRSYSYSRNPSSPMPWKSEKKPHPAITDSFHVIHKVPVGDSPYVKAKHVQLIDKDPSRAISLFWAAINSGDRVDSALKDMAVVMKQLNRCDEAIEAIKSFRHLCSLDSQESIENVLVELYKRSGRLDEQIEVLKAKLKRIEDGTAFGGKRTKMARSQGKKVHITVEQEYARLLGNLAWAYLQQNNYEVAEEYYRKALSIELDRNKQCNLVLCLLHMNKITEAKIILQAIKSSAGDLPVDESYAKSFERAAEFLDEIESDTFRRDKENSGNNQLPLDMTGRNGKGGALFAEIERKPDHQHQFDNEDSTSGLGEENPGCLPLRQRSDFNHSFNYTPPVVPWRTENPSPFTQPKTSQRKGTSNGPNRRLQFEAPLVTDNAEASSHVGRVSLWQKPNQPPPLYASKDQSRTVSGHPVCTKSVMESKLENNSWKGQGHSWNKNMPADSTLNPRVKEDCQKKAGGQEKLQDRELVVSMLKQSPSVVEEPESPETMAVQDFQNKKSWADMAEEEEQELVIEVPVDSGHYPSTDLSLPSYTENHPDSDMSYIEQHLNQKFKSYDHRDKENASSGKCPSSKCPTTHRSLSFDRQRKQDLDDDCSTSPNTDIKKQVDGMSRVPADASKPNLGNKCVFKSMRKRLQVFEDIALLHESPRA